MRKNLHTFVICAYEDSPYLAACIASLRAQTVSSVLRLTTSTPSPFLENICQKNGIEYHVREGRPGIGDDWNEALSLADTKYVTIVHQDDIYEPDYAKNVIIAGENTRRITGSEPQIIFTDYSELVDGVKYGNRRNLKIKRVLLTPLSFPRLQAYEWAKRSAIKFGNAISCPTVTYNIRYIRQLLKEEGKETLFSDKYRSNIDWEAWEWLSRKEGAFVYIGELLAAHRIHGGSETTRIINDNNRTLEDGEIFSKFWPKPVVKVLNKVYKNSEKTNNI